MNSEGLNQETSLGKWDCSVLISWGRGNVGVCTVELLRRVTATKAQIWEATGHQVGLVLCLSLPKVLHLCVTRNKNNNNNNTRVTHSGKSAMLGPAFRNS